MATAAARAPGRPEERINHILYLACKIQLENLRVAGRAAELELDTPLIDCIVAGPAHPEEAVEETLRRYRALRDPAAAESAADRVKFVFGLRRDLDEGLRSRAARRGPGRAARELTEIKLDADNRGSIDCAHANLAHHQVRELMDAIHRTRPSRSPEYFAKFCLNNYEEILRKELLDIHEPAGGSLVCDRRAVADRMASYCRAQGYRLRDLLVVPLYDACTPEAPYANGNLPVMLCFLYVSRADDRRAARRPAESVMLTLMNLGKYSLVADGKFEAMIPLTDVARVERVATFTARLSVRTAAEGPAEAPAEPEPSRDPVEEMFTAKFSLLAALRAEKSLEASELIRALSGGGGTREVRAPITLMQLHVKCPGLVRYTLHSPFLDEAQLTQLLGQVFAEIDHNAPSKKTAVYTDFLKRCYMHTGMNFVLFCAAVRALNSIRPARLAGLLEVIVQGERVEHVRLVALDNAAVCDHLV